MVFIEIQTPEYKRQKYSELLIPSRLITGLFHRSEDTKHGILTVFLSVVGAFIYFFFNFSLKCWVKTSAIHPLKFNLNNLNIILLYVHNLVYLLCNGMYKMFFHCYAGCISCTYTLITYKVNSRLPCIQCTLALQYKPGHKPAYTIFSYSFICIYCAYSVVEEVLFYFSSKRRNTTV